MFWSFYDEKTGLFKPRVVGCPERLLAINTPTGYVPIRGRFDHLSQRVDIATGKVVDYQPPQPSADHEWSAELKRWIKRADVLQREVRDQQARQRIDDLERASWRPLRELQLDPDNAEARQRLAEIDGEIAAKRADL